MAALRDRNKDGSDLPRPGGCAIDGDRQDEG
jgi:hypothetical protein